MSARALAALVAALLLLGCSKPESEELKRARQLVTDRQWATARDALKQVLKTEPRSKVARGLLLSCLDNTAGLEKVAGVSPYFLYQVAWLQTSPPWLTLPADARAEAERAVIEVRKALFDEGIDTKDTADLAAVLVEAARQALVASPDVERQEAAAAILALSGVESFPGRSDAITFLIERLKGKDTAQAIAYLVDIGAAAEARLRAAVADKGFMGRAGALEALARVLASERARALAARAPELRAFSKREASVSGVLHLGESAIPDFRDLDVSRVHAQYVPLEDGNESALVLLQAWNDLQREVVAEVHVFRGGGLHALTASGPEGKPLELAAHLIHKLTRQGDEIWLYRELEQTFDIEVEAGRLSSPTPGARVLIRGHGVRGALVREEEGLWIVKPDVPVQGMTELPAAASSLIALAPERRTERSTERLVARLEDRELRIQAIERVSDGDPLRR